MRIDSISFKVLGRKRVGVRVAPSDANGRRPGLLMLHGFPGAEKNVDIARALAAQGWVCWLPHFRGSWGSHGHYSFSGILEDTEYFWRHFLKDPLVDTTRAAILGFSMGGWAALNFAAKAKDVKAVVALAPMAGAGRWFNGHARDKVLELARTLEINSKAELWRNFKDALTEGDPLKIVAELAPRPLLFVHGTNDELVPYSLGRELFDQAREAKRFVTIPKADHQFSEHRPYLVKTVVSWLTANL